MKILETNIPFEKKLINISLLFSKELESNNLIPNFIIKSYSDLLTDLFWISDVTGKYIFANEKTCKVLFNTINYIEIAGKDDILFSKGEFNDDNNIKKTDEINEKPILIYKYEKVITIVSNKISFQIFYVPIKNNQHKTIAYVGYAEYNSKKCCEKPLKQFATVWEESFDSMRLLNEDGTFLAVNKAFCKLIEMSEIELIGKPYNYIYSEAEYNPKEMFNMKNVRPFFEREVILWNNKHVWFEITSSVINYEDGTKSVLSIFKDITDTKKTTKKLEEVEQRYKDTADLLPQSICEVNIEGKITYCNKQAYKSFKFSEEDIQNGCIIFDYIAEVDRDRIWKNFNNRLNGIEFPNVEYLALAKDGTKFPILIFSTVIIKEKRAVGLRSVIIDISDRKKSELDLKESEAKFRMIAENTSDVIWIMDSDFKYTYISPSIKKQRGYTPEEFLQLPITEVYDTESYEKMHMAFNNFKEKSKTQKPDANLTITYEVKHKCKNQTYIWGEVIINPVLNSDGALKSLHGVTRNINERKKIEESLRKSESLYKNIVNTSPDGILLVDLDVNIIYANDRTAQLFGFNTGFEMLGINGFSFISSESTSLVNEKYFLLIKHGNIEPLEVKFNKKNNTSFWGEFRTKLITDNNGNPFNIMVIITDITLKKEAEEEKKLSELRMETLLSITEMENSPIGDISNYVLQEAVKQTKSEGGFIAFLNENEQIISVKSLTNNQIVEKFYNQINYSNSISSLLWTKPLLIRSPFFQNDYTSAYLLNEKLPGSTTFIKRYLGIPIFSGNKMIALAGIINKKSDYTEFDVKQLTLLVNGLFITLEHRKNEEQIKTLSRAIEQNPSIIIITNPDGIIQYTNPKFTEITGYSAAEVKGLNPRILKSGQTTKETYEQLWNTITKGYEWDGELLNRRKNGNFYWEHVLISPIKSDSGEITNYVAIKQDVSEKKITEKQLIEAKEQAEKSDKIKSEFLAQMSHEIRTPINAILSFSSLLRDELENILDDDLRSSFSIMARAGERIIRTIDLILNMSELQTGTYDFHIKEIDLKEDILHSLMLEHTMLARDKGLMLSLNSNTDNTYIFADEYSVSQIFANLINNAIKFTESGVVEIEISNGEKGSIVVDIIDTGIGISEDYVPFLFSPFTQEEQGYTRRFEGNGLGLALVKKYCDLNKAQITVDSLKGKGSKFSVTFYSDDCII